MTTISQERVKWDAVPGRPTMRRREHWGARRAYTDARTVNEPATRVFVHISITNPSNYNSYDAHARAIEAIGISRFPATGISYNRMFMAGSTVVREGQPIGRRGAHTVNDFKRSPCTTSGCPGRGSSLTAPSWNLNYNARAYVWCANVNNTVPDSVVELIALAIYTDYRAGFITKGAAQNIHGHRCVSAKGCPGDRMWSRMKDIQARVNQLIANRPTPPPPPPPEDDMELAELMGHTIDTGQGPRKVVTLLANAALLPVTYADTKTALDNQAKLVIGQAQILATLNADPVDETALARELAPLLAPALVAAVAAELGDAVGVTEEQVEAVLRRVLGSLSEPVNPT